jgi:hypothetical protein
MAESVKQMNVNRIYRPESLSFVLQLDKFDLDRLLEAASHRPLFANL